MGKGFAPVLPRENKAQLKPELPLTSINEIQASLLTYLQDIPDPRVSRTQKHLLTDILVIAIQGKSISIRLDKRLSAQQSYSYYPWPPVYF
ncbi:transposase family protein [Microcystis aeruginosa]|uniref:transposase family protein n=1 Tax=Microcystis aeruginosa TaxID=1126 RepID=UPI000AF5490C|nr:transposase family protein [Microcystis aeruginosa]BCU11338.1 hypothetical protein MAN88_19020 [Microcystis aeruginosa]